MDVIALVAQKGGTGKTTLALAIAVAAHQAGASAAVIDLDPQASASIWFDRRQQQAPVVVSAQPVRLSAHLTSLETQGSALTVIDTSPRADAAALQAAKAATLVVIPCRPSVFDLESLQATRELLQATGTPVRVVAVLNDVPPVGREVDEARGWLASLQIPVCPVTIGHRKAFPYAAVLGQTPQEYDPSGKAAMETAALYQWLCLHLHTGTPAGVNHG